MRNKGTKTNILFLCISEILLVFVFILLLLTGYYINVSDQLNDRIDNNQKLYSLLLKQLDRVKPYFGGMIEQQNTDLDDELSNPSQDPEILEVMRRVASIIKALEALPVVIPEMLDLVKELRQRLSASRFDNHNASEEIEELRRKIAEYEATISSYKDDASRAKDKEEQKITTIAHLQELNEKLELVVLQLMNEAIEFNDIQQDIDNAEQENERLQSYIEQLRRLNTEKESEIGVARAEANKWKQKYDKVKGLQSCHFDKQNKEKMVLELYFDLSGEHVALSRQLDNGIDAEFDSVVDSLPADRQLSKNKFYFEFAEKLKAIGLSRQCAYYARIFYPIEPTTFLNNSKFIKIDKEVSYYFYLSRKCGEGSNFVNCVHRPK